MRRTDGLPVGDAPPPIEGDGDSAVIAPPAPAPAPAAGCGVSGSIVLLCSVVPPAVAFTEDTGVRRRVTPPSTPLVAIQTRNNNNNRLKSRAKGYKDGCAAAAVSTRIAIKLELNLSLFSRSIYSFAPEQQQPLLERVALLCRLQTA